MAFASNIRFLEAGIAHRVATAYHNLTARMQQDRMYRRTFNELSRLSNRELNDMGISRASIIDVSRQAAYGK